MSKHNAREPFSKTAEGRIRRTARRASDKRKFAYMGTI